MMGMMGMSIIEICVGIWLMSVVAVLAYLGSMFIVDALDMKFVNGLICVLCPVLNTAIVIYLVLKIIGICVYYFITHIGGWWDDFWRDVNKNML